jgi:LVIVD repeat
MSLPLKTSISFAFAIALLLAGMAMPGQAAAADKGMSPALCGPGDTPEPGIQGDVPAGQTANYSCGVKLVGELPGGGNVQGDGKCAYVRNGDKVSVIDVSDPAKPVEVTSVKVQGSSETMRAVVTDKRAVLVSGSSVYDISDCLHPVLKGEIKWPPLSLPGIRVRLAPHDIRVNREGTKVYASFGLWEADIANLQDPNSWTVTDYRCELAAQIPGPWQEVHKQALKAGLSLCDDATKPNPMGANYVMGASPLQASLLWPQVSHSPDFNADDTRVYLGDQAGGTSGRWAPQPKVQIVDLTKSPLKILGAVDGPGHGLDWFRAGGHEYLLHSNEGGNGATGLANQVSGGGSDTCKPYPRPSSLGWGFEVFVSDVTRPERARNVSMLHLAINDPEFCNARKASGRDPWVSYHMVDNPLDAKFAAVNFGSAGLRIFDIRKPTSPVEVAYFNHGPLVHAGVSHYDAARGLLYVPGAKSFWVLEIEPQVRARLGL